MLTAVENEPAIRRYQRQFVRGFRPMIDEVVPVALGHLGASIRAKVSWSEGLGIWFFSKKISEQRYWNAFGIGRPEAGSRVSITCEINFPFCGIDRRTGGAFAEDGAGRVFVVHRGKLGGGRKGVGKGLFENHYRGAWEWMDDGGEETPVAIIGVLRSPRFARQIAQFVRKIERIKERAATRSVQAEFSFDELALREELMGDPFPDRKRDVGSDCDLGLIVRDLSDALKAQGLRTGNDGCRDLLAISRTGRIRAVFQVLSDMSLTCLHAAVTRLLLNGLTLPGNPILLLALPRAPEEDLRDKLRRLNINLLIYGWEEDRTVFPDLASCISRIET